MINKTELRIGNKVKQAHATLTVTAIGTEKVMATDFNRTGACTYKNIDPIPLSPEVLEKCGFGMCCEGNEYRIGLPLGNGTDLVIEVLEQPSGPYDALISDTTADEHPRHYSYVKAVRSLHQLQNLYFALTGEELNYKSNYIAIKP